MSQATNKKHELWTALAVFAALAAFTLLMIALNREGAGNKPLPGTESSSTSQTK